MKLPKTLAMVAVVSTLILSLEAAAEIRYVSPGGSDAADGKSAASAWQTIPHALGQLSAGEVLIVGEGTYYHEDTTRVTIEGLSNCWIVAQPRGKAVISNAWKQAREAETVWELVEDGIYRTADPGLLHTAAFWNTTFLQRVPLETLKTGSLSMSNRTYTTPRVGFAVESDGHVYVRLPAGADPNGESLVFQRKSTSGLFLLRSSPGLVIDGLVFEGAEEAAIISTGGGCDGLHLRNTEFRMCKNGLIIRWSNNLLIEWNEYHFPGYDNYIKHVRELTTSREDLDISYQMGKRYFDNEGGLIQTARTRNLIVRFNYAHNAFDGIGIAAADNVRCHHNVFWGLGDNAIETDWLPEPFGNDMHISHNLFVNVKRGAISQQWTGKYDEIAPGPFYIYRNVLIGYRASGWNPWTVFKAPSHQWQNGYHVFHNTIWVKKACLYSLATSQTTPEAVSRVHWRNNLLLFDNQLQNCHGYGSTIPESQIAGNILASQQRTEYVLANGGRYFDSMDSIQFTAPALGMHDDGDIGNDPFDFSLQPGSPAVDGGADLPDTYPKLTFVGKPDVGAVESGVDKDEYGIPYDSNWPRVRYTVYDETTPEGFAPLPGQVVASRPLGGGATLQPRAHIVAKAHYLEITAPVAGGVLNIMSMAGRMVRTIPVAAGTSRVNPDLTTGCYLVSVQSRGSAAGSTDSARRVFWGGAGIR